MNTSNELLEDILHTAAYQQFDMAEHDLCAAYYEGYQETDELRALRKELHKPTDTPNLYFKYMNTVAGMEEQQRVDIMVAADDDNEETEDVAEALNKLMHETCRLHDVNSITAEAWLPQANAGLGWVYFAKNTDVLGTPFVCENVNEPEIIWDRRSRKRDLADCRFIARRRFLSHNECIGLLPEHKELIESTFATSCSDWGPIKQSFGGTYTHVDTSEYSHHLERDKDRKTVAVFDVYYRVHEKREVLFYEDGRREVYDETNAAHVKAKMTDGVPVALRHVQIMRNAWYIGAYKISDEISPHPHNNFPYVLFRGMQEKKSGACFALGRTLIAPQNAYNSAHVQQQYLMEKVTILVKKGALSGTNNETLEDVQREAHMADGVIELNSMDDIEIRHHYEQIAHLGEMKRDAEYTMETASGISNSLTGQQDQNKSGVAQQVQVEQATVTLSKLFANYFYGRMILGRLILAHLIDQIGTTPQQVTIKSETGDVVKTVDLNTPGDDGKLTNAVPMARTRVVLDDIESSRGYRAQNMQMIQNITPNADDTMKPYLTLAALKLSNLPDRHELIKDMQKMIGKGATEEEQEAMDQAAADQQKEMFDLEKREREAEIALKTAQAQEALARAQAATSKIGQQGAANDDQMMERKQAKVTQIREALAQKALA